MGRCEKFRGGGGDGNRCGGEIRLCLLPSVICNLPPVLPCPPSEAVSFFTDVYQNGNKIDLSPNLKMTRCSKSYPPMDKFSGEG
jgi:hypothetical protein